MASDAPAPTPATSKPLSPPPTSLLSFENNKRRVVRAKRGEENRSKLTLPNRIQQAFGTLRSPPTCPYPYLFLPDQRLFTILMEFIFISTFLNKHFNHGVLWKPYGSARDFEEPYKLLVTSCDNLDIFFALLQSS